MGFKTKINQNNICNSFKIGGLIFDSLNDYQLFKDIDRNINQTVNSVNNGNIDLIEFFNKIKNINVKETYCDASEEMDDLFRNATTLLCYENTRYKNDYEVGKCFFDKINILRFNDSNIF